MPDTAPTWDTDNRWTTDGMDDESRAALTARPPAVYSARWIDHGDRVDMVPDRQGFAYDTVACRDALIGILEASGLEAKAVSMLRRGDDTPSRFRLDGATAWVRRAGGYFYVLATYEPTPRTDDVNDLLAAVYAQLDDAPAVVAELAGTLRAAVEQRASDWCIDHDIDI